MDVKELAQRAVESLGAGCSESGTAPFSDLSAKTAAIGFLQGVASGANSMGQNWLAEIFINRMSHLRTDAQNKVIEELFASGMCSAGQQFSLAKSALLQRTH